MENNTIKNQIKQIDRSIIDLLNQRSQIIKESQFSSLTPFAVIKTLDRTVRIFIYL